jgi:hypothetical protein
METQTKIEYTDDGVFAIDLAKLFVIVYFDGTDNYWSGSGNYTTIISDARLYKTREHAQMVADKLIATKPIVQQVKIVKIDD